jgi:hypothetical protein
MVELNKLHNSRMIDKDFYLTAMTYFQRETQTQTHSWKARTFILLLESCRLSWLEENFRRRGDGGGGGGGRSGRVSILLSPTSFEFLPPEFISLSSTSPTSSSTSLASFSSSSLASSSHFKCTLQYSHSSSFSTLLIFISLLLTIFFGFFVWFL